MEPKKFSKYIGKGLRLSNLIDKCKMHYLNEFADFGRGYNLGIDLLTQESEIPCDGKTDTEGETIVGILVMLSEDLTIERLHFYHSEGKAGSNIGNYGDGYLIDWDDDALEYSSRHMVAFMDLADENTVDLEHFNHLYELRRFVEIGLTAELLVDRE